MEKERTTKRVKRIAALLEACTAEELAQLVELVPRLREAQRLAEVEKEAIEHFRRVLSRKRGTPLALDEPFLGGLTYGEYLALSPEAEDALWERLFAEAEEALGDLEETDARRDARLPVHWQAKRGQ